MRNKFINFGVTALKFIRKPNQNHADIQNMMALLELQKLLKGYMPWSVSAMQPSAIQQVLNEIILNDKNTIIEFGSGLSTLYIAALLKKRKGVFFSVEHDQEWLERMREIVCNEGLEDNVKFVHAPLESSKLSLKNLLWYSKSELDRNIGGQKFDLVVVDGPLAYQREIQLSRYPALPYLVESRLLNDNYTLILDDAQRPGEKEIIRRWGKLFDCNFIDIRSKGIAIAKSRRAFTI